MSRLYRLLAVAVFGGLALSLFGPAVSAQEKKQGPNLLGEKKTEAVKTTPQVEYAGELALAGELIRYGRSKKAPEALLTAVRILHGIPTAKRTEKPKVEEGTKKATGNTKARPRDDSPKALLAEARKMGGENKAVAALADQVARDLDEAPRGEVRGPLKSLETILPFGTHNFRMTFQGRQLARVIMDGDSGTDLDLFIYDEFGNLIRSDIGLTDYANLTWVPRFTGPFTVRIVNLGGRSNRYFLINN